MANVRNYIQINPIDNRENVALGVRFPFNAEGVFYSTYTTKEQIKSNLINILLTEPGERLHQPNFGVGLLKYLFEQDMSTTVKSNDYQMVSHRTTGSFGTIIARVHKSETQNKQFIETFYYWNETRDGELVARARVSASYSSGSYGSSYTTPTLQILGTRVKDLTILKG